MKRNYSLISGDIRDYSRLQIFHIYFDTSTYDEVEKDVKVTMEGMLGVVGGTMGLLTGNNIDWKTFNIFKCEKDLMKV